MNWLNFKYMFFSYCDFIYKYSEGFRRFSKRVQSYLTNGQRDLVLACLNRFESAKDVDKTGIVQAGSGEFSNISFAVNAARYRTSFGVTKLCHMAHVLHGKSHITRASTFSLYFWSFKIGLGMHYLRYMQFSLSSIWHLFKGKKMFCSWRFMTLATQCWEFWKRRKSFWWSTAKRKRAIGWFWFVFHQQSFETYHYHNTAIPCCMR